MSGMSLSDMRDALREAQALVAAVAAQLAEDTAHERVFWRVVDRDGAVVYDNIDNLAETASLRYGEASYNGYARIIEVREREVVL